MSSKKSKLDPKLAKEVEEFDVENHFAIGNFLDIKDTEYNWCNAQIIDVDEQKRTLEVHFDSWSKKYDEVCFFSLLKIFTSIDCQIYLKQNKTFQIGDLLLHWSEEEHPERL